MTADDVIEIIDLLEQKGIEDTIEATNLKTTRLLEMIIILLNRQSITAKELANRFSVSTRTVYRDIETLSLAGIPVCTSKGKRGGISLLEDYTLNKALLSKNESEGDCSSH